ncbi:ABC transporter ATP-binding protein [Actinomyces minihominis]|uniref:ABC transporter ATP-binding protein n=1 Tax=Actinomyces minihominis TaxID=2002838 RepID=UPI000C07B311|nr:ABC transporter ATP-binding protein [Actinomyces minihominis]
MLGKLLAKYLWPYRWYLLGVIVFQMASVIANLYLPTLNAQIIDQGVARGDIGLIWMRGGWMLAISFIQITASIISLVLAARASMAMGRDLRNAVYAKVSSFSEREVNQFGPGSLITRNTNDIQQVQMLVMMGSTMLVMAPLMAIGGIIMALRQDVQLSWVLAVAIPILMVVSGLLMLRLIPLFREYQERLDTVNRVLREQLTGVRVIRAFVRERIEAGRFLVANTDIMVVGRNVGSLFVILFPAVMLILNVTTAGVIWFGAFRIDQGTMEVGTIMAFMQYIAQVLFGIVMATFMGMMIPRAVVSAERISEVLNSQASLEEPSDPVFEQPLPGNVEMKDVSFTFPDAEEPVISNISFVAPRGKTTAIVGSTAAGKTTLVNLIPRLFDVTGGTVLVGGIDVRRQDLETLWSSIGYIPQKPILFAGTVASNLRFGKANATDEELWHALRVAQAEDFVSKMDGQLEAKISQGGTNVSGGQAQRLSIARALVRNPQVLIFDDSFSALDLTTDARLRAALWQAFPETTKIVVAQRISTITDAEQILVLEDGQIVGSGTHTQLLETSPTYLEIVESQLAAEVA